MLKSRIARHARVFLRLSMAGKAEHIRDAGSRLGPDPGINRAIDAALVWLGHAQDGSVTQDGGVARHFSLETGWSSSYPETTGYIIPTLLDQAALRNDDSLRQRAKRMLDWLLKIQLPSGGFQGGTVDQTPVVPVTFNTGQILMGLAAGVDAFGDVYRPAMRAAADWLVETQDPDGCWRKAPTPFAARGEKAYETHVAWGLLEAARRDPNTPYADAALANVRWALGKQLGNGWFADCCLSDPTQPLTHTIGYVLRGILEAWRFTGDATLLDAARKSADGILSALRVDGYLPGRLDSQWRGTVAWVCLTGSVQIAHCWLMLYQETGDTRYRDAAFAANRYVRRTQQIEGSPGTCGGIKGSLPVYGGYGTHEYLNWAAKFFIDSNHLERTVRAHNG